MAPIGQPHLVGFFAHEMKESTLNWIAGAFVLIIIIALARVVLLCMEDSKRGREYRRDWNEWQRKKVID